MSNATNDELFDRFLDDNDVQYELRLVINNEPVRTISDSDIGVVQADRAEQQLGEALNEYIKDYYLEDI